ncbi:MAG: reductive dehalogenase [Deltaproteobacteria bacterium]|nr:reductive dehalogenase [Deltaproteobacteria bacterium]
MNGKKSEFHDKGLGDFPFPVPDYRFDQKNEMFKRRTWDGEIKPHGDRLYNTIRYQDKYGYRKLDYALRNAAWNIEYSFAFGNMRSDIGLYSWSDIADKIKRFVETNGPVQHSPGVNSRIVKKAARFLGADLVGICKVHPNLVYSHEYDLINMEHRPIELPQGCHHAVVMAVEMDYDATRYSPDAIAGAATGMGYSRQAIVANLLATFIRGLGYRAIPSGNDTALSIPLAMAAGLGELGRMGLLVTEKYGPRVRLCKVFTDLPLEPDTFRPFGVKEFCQACKKCAKNCPSRAIAFGPPTMKGPSLSNFSGVMKWYINPEKCFLFWVKNWMDCDNCVKVCPFNKPQGKLHDFVRAVIRKMPILSRPIVWIDDMLGYGSPVRRKNFWETT